MFSNSIIHQAPLKIIGYWKNEYLRQTHVYPHPKDFVDEEWETATRQKVIECLENGVVHNYQRGFSTCRFSGKPNGNSELTDGVLIWPEGLAHYLKNYNVRLPQPVVDHFLGYRYDKTDLDQKIKTEAYFEAGFDFEYWQKFKDWQPPGQLGKWKIKPEIPVWEENVLTLIGFWEGDRNPVDDDTAYPHPKAFIDKNWDTEKKAKVIAYMKTCTVVTSEPIFSHDKCLFTGKKLSNRVLSDGHYFFPENYIYYIEEQSVRPLDCFTEHCLKHTNTWKDDIADTDYDVEMYWWEDLRFIF